MRKRNFHFLVFDCNDVTSLSSATLKLILLHLYDIKGLKNSAYLKVSDKTSIKVIELHIL